MGRTRAVAHPSTPPPTVPSPRPTQRTTRTIREIQLQESAADQPREILFGRTTQGLKLLYANSFLNGTVLYLVAAIGEGPVRSITPRVDENAMLLQSGSAINPNGAYYTWGAVKAYVYDGGQAAGTQEVASGLNGPSFDPTFNTQGPAWTNLAYVVLVLTWNQSLSSLPKFTFDVEGYRDLYDPRTSTRGYSENTALVIRELMTNTRWGMQIAAANIDDQTFRDAADDCAVPLFPPSPGAAPGLSVVATAGNLYGLFWYTYTNVHSNGMESLESPLAGYVFPQNQQ
ncbi:MAG TPA: hypothetical protein VN605_09720, partial [Thermoanaerobaculia bacterium]|nr:hypothetical protein [Thermoanaerobaculia bacterium]